MKKCVLSIIAGLVSGFCAASTGEARWIWNPGDYAIWMGNRLQSERIERGVHVEPFWPIYNYLPRIIFTKKASFDKPEVVEVRAEGEVSIRVNTHMRYMPVVNGKATLPPGDLTITVSVWNWKLPPALYIRGENLVTDSSWKCRWSLAEPWGAVETSPAFSSPDTPPKSFRLETRREKPIETRRLSCGRVFVDFGRETFGYPVIKNVSKPGNVKIIYGESEPEALDLEDIHVDAWHRVDIPAGDTRISEARGFRYLHVVPKDETQEIGAIEMDFEFLPIPRKGRFRCNDEEMNRIWDVAADTLHLTTREAYLDGIKRDRWVWSGDAYQSFLMGYYLFDDRDIVKRTLWILRGGDPVRMHINQIMDYSFYWFSAIYDYHLYHDDKVFLEQIYPKMVSLMDFVEGRLDEHGRPVDREGDWMFIDWAPVRLHNKGGVTAFEMMLLSRAYEAISEVALILGKKDAAAVYKKRGAKLRADVIPLFWNKERGGLMHLRKHDGTWDEQFTRYPNMFGLMWGYFDDDQRKSVLDNVIFNDNVMKIVTPYMRFYELAALCEFGRHKEVLGEISSYWGGMLKLGATSFWERYNTDVKGAIQYAMYGKPYGKSFCHAWGASPIYLFGRYYLGVVPTAPGFTKYEVRPVTGGLEWMEGSVPTPKGDVTVSVRDGVLTVTGCGGEGEVIWNGRRHKLAPNATLKLESGKNAK